MKLVKILSAPAVIAAAGMVMTGCEIPAGNEAASLPGAVGTAGGKPGQSLAAVLDETSKTVSYYWHTEGWNHESVRDTGLDVTQINNPAEFDNGVFRIKKRAGTIPVKFYKVTGGGDAPIVVGAGVTKDMILEDSTITPDDVSPIELEDGATLILMLRGKNKLTASGGLAGIHVTTNRTLTITSADGGDGATSGMLTASVTGLDTSGYAGAGIGGNSGEDAGTITIASGTVYATGGTGGAGIGGGYSGSGGTITITGGTGTATGGSASYGIGPGESGTGGTLNGSAINWPAVNSFTWPGINLGIPFVMDPGVTYSDGVFTIADGTTVTVRGATTENRIVVNGTATLTFDDASIDLSGATGSASPLDLADGANVTLKLNGASTLTASEGAAGVHVTTGRTLTITSSDGDGQTTGSLTTAGGTLTGTKGASWSGAGIGGGYEEDAGTINIAGGTVSAISGRYSAGIGSGDWAGGGIIIIKGGQISATGYGGGAGIGGGYQSPSVSVEIHINDPNLGGGNSHGTARGLNWHSGPGIRSPSIGPGNWQSDDADMSIGGSYNGVAHTETHNPWPWYNPAASEEENIANAFEYTW